MIVIVVIIIVVVIIAKYKYLLVSWNINKLISSRRYIRTVNERFVDNSVLPIPHYIHQDINCPHEYSQ